MSAPFPHPASTVLVVDDEQLSRRVAYRILSEEGYRVLEAENCAEALDVIRLADGKIDVVMVDVVMPIADGVAIVRQIRELWPQQRIMYMSAHPAQVLVKHGLTDLDVTFLAKPYTRGEILAKLRQALERHPSPAQPAPAAKDRLTGSILLVEDDEQTRRALGRVLERAGHQVVQAENGAEALRLWKESPGDLVILDLFMPEKDGIETIVELKEQDPEIRIIAISGGGSQGRVEVLRDAKLLGADLAIQKPFESAELLGMIQQVLAYSRETPPQP